MRDGRNIDNFITFIKVAIDLDDKLYKKKIERNLKNRK